MRPAYALIIGLLICPIAFAINSNGTGGGDWDAGASWTGGVAPANGDTAVILNGDDISMNEDMSGWANGVTLTINAGGTLSVPTGAGTYYFLTSADITNNGTIQAGTSTSVPLPFVAKFTIDFNGTGSSIECNGGGEVKLYCTEPTYTHIHLSAQEAAGQTILSVDTDVTSDIWAVGDTIRIDDNNYGVESEERVIAVGGIAANTITITAGLTAQKESGATVVLCTRNIYITGSTTYFLKDTKSTKTCYIGAHVDCTNGIFGDFDAEIAGVFNGVGTCIFSVNGVIASGMFTGCTAIANTCIDAIFSGHGSGSSNIFVQCNGADITGTFIGGSYADSASSSINIINASITKCTGGLLNSSDVLAAGCTFDNTTELLNRLQRGKFYNCSFAGTEFSGYNGSTRTSWAYVESLDHDQTTDAFKSWCRGGITLSQTASPPTGYTVWYEHTCESASYPCFRQFEVAVLAGETFEAVGKIRIADGDDMSADPPFLAIVDQFADPLVDSAQSYLDQDFVPIDDGSETGWQDVSVVWTNSGNIPRYVYLRMQAQHATAVVDEVIGVSSLLVNIGSDVDAIVAKLPTNYIMGSDDQDDHNSELEDWADGGRLDLIIDLINTNTDLITIVSTDVSAPNDVNNFQIAAGQDADDAFNNHIIMVQDAGDSNYELRLISDYEYTLDSTNDFSGDADCIGLWKMEDGALTVDTIGTNTLTSGGGESANTTTKKEGNASLDVTSGSNDYLSITDASLDSGFPGKSGEANGTLSICFWIRFDSIPPAYGQIVGKYLLSGNKRSYTIGTDGDAFSWFWGTAGGGSVNWYTHASTISTGVWYHVGVTCDDVALTYRIRIWDDDAGAIFGVDKTGSIVNAMNIEDAPFFIGDGADFGGAYQIDGLIDEVVIFDDVLSTSEIDQIRAGTYGGGATHIYDVTVNEPFSFTPATSDLVYVMGTSYGADSAAIADTVWDELVADHTGELTFGGEVGGLDPNITLIKAKTDLITIIDTTIAVSDTNESFTLTDGIAVDDAWNGSIIMIQDADDSHWELRIVEDWTSAKVVTVERPMGFVPAIADVVHVMGTAYVGDIWDVVRRIPFTTNYIDTITPGGAGTPGTVRRYDASGDDP